MATAAPSLESAPRSRLRRLLVNRWTKTLGVLGLIGLAVLAGGYTWFARGLPSADKLLAYQPPLPTNVRDYDGTPVHAFARERRIELAYDEFPPQLIHAFISAEDKTFFSHHGIDVGGLAAAVVDYVRKHGTGERARGGSTITQQVAKNLLQNDAYTVSRKVREAILAIRIERTLSKQQILDIYLNQIFLGRNAYGVEAASRAYFGKDVTGLDVEQMAYLATLPKAPANYDPDRFPDRATARRNYVLNQMQLNGYITADEKARAEAAPLETVARTGLPDEPQTGGYYMEEVRRELIDKYGTTEADGPYSVYGGGLWVRTSYDPAVQEAAQTALRHGLMRYDAGRGWAGPAAHIDPSGNWVGALDAIPVGTGPDEWQKAVVLSKAGGEATIGLPDGSQGTLPSGSASMPRRGMGGSAFNYLKAGDVIVVRHAGGTSWALEAPPVISGGMVVENPHTGQILAMQGGWDVRGSSFNRATQALRQPGSAFKPIVYSAALEGGMTPASIIVDGPFCVYQSARLGTKCFKNFSGGGSGPHTMRWGVEQSRNLMTVRAASQTGMDKVVAVAKALGVGNYPPELAYSLGAGDTTVLKLTNAYSILANNGRALKPTLIDYIEDRNGHVIYKADTRPCEGCNMPDWNGQPMPRPRIRGAQLVDPISAYQMVHIMEGVVQRGTATVLRDLGRPLFGKTGTNSGPTSVWFVGGSQDMVGGVYLGYDHPRPLGGYAQGGTVSAPVFREFAAAAMKDMPVVPFKIGQGVRMVRIDRASGRRVYGGWPTDDPKTPIIWEAFKPESEPRRAVGHEAVTKAAPAAAAPKRGNQADSDFLNREGGIY